MNNITLISPTDFYLGTVPRPTFSWNSLSGATEYFFELSSFGDMSSPLIMQSVLGTQFQVPSDLTLKNVYYWRVTALVNSAIEKSYVRSFVVGYAAPTNVVFKKSFGDTANISWDFAGTGHAGFLIKYGPSSGNYTSSESVSVSTQRFKKIKGLYSDTVYAAVSAYGYFSVDPAVVAQASGEVIICGQEVVASSSGDMLIALERTIVPIISGADLSPITTDASDTVAL